MPCSKAAILQQDGGLRKRWKGPPALGVLICYLETHFLVYVKSLWRQAAEECLQLPPNPSGVVPRKASNCKGAHVIHGLSLPGRAGIHSSLAAEKEAVSNAPPQHIIPSSVHGHLKGQTMVSTPCEKAQHQ